MKTNKVVAAVLILAILFGAIVPQGRYQVQASDTTLIEVTRDNAPIRDDKVDSGNIVARCKEGAVLVSTGSTINYKLHKWYVVKFDGKEYFIYSGNVKVHSHDYKCIEVLGMTFSLCDCGIFERVSSVPKNTEVISIPVPASIGTSVVSGSAVLSLPTTTALEEALVALGGMVPAVGEAVVPYLPVIVTGAAILLAFLFIINKDATFEMMVEVLETLDLVEVVEINKGNQYACEPEEFRLVTRMNGNLYYSNSECYSIAEAYVLALSGQDVYNPNRQYAEMCASMNIWYFEERDKNQPEYYWHFHLGTASPRATVSKGHVFYGMTDSGAVPR